MHGPGDEATSQRRARKRRRIAESDRQRSSIACSSCRRLKEKCDGRTPCARCTRHGRRCELRPADPREESSTAPHSTSVEDVERVAYLESIARHFLGEMPLTVENLRNAVPGLTADAPNGNSSERPSEGMVSDFEEDRFTVKAVSQNTVHYSGELSHWSFSQRVKDRVDKRLRKNNYQDLPIVELWRASHLRSEDWITLFSKQNLPPWDIAVFLTDIYFDYAQINDFYVSREWLNGKLTQLYSFDQTFSAEDAGWIGSVLMAMAVGTQFAHMTDRHPQEPSPIRNDEDEATENAVGMTLFHLSSRLVPDMIAVASVESMQAFMLLAHFALPLDTPCTAYTYLGLALKMAIQNGLHRGYRDAGLSEETFDLRTRLFWTAYRLDTRVSVLHGRPPSMRSVDIDVAYPADSLATSSPEDTALRQKENLATRLTEWLLNFADSIHSLRRCPEPLRSTYLDRLLQTRQRFKQWWRSQPTSSTPKADFSRSEAHSHLCYNLNLVFMGRPFMFTDSKESQHADRAKPSSSVRNELVQDAVAAAFEITDICDALDSSTGLARASYVEFSSIRAALLAILAQSLNEITPELREKLSLGMRLIRSMAVDILSTRCEASVISAIEAAVRQLEDGTNQTAAAGGTPQVESAQTGELKYQKWTSLWQDHPEGSSATEQPSPLPTVFESSDVRDFLGDIDWTPFDPSLFEGDLLGVVDGLPINEEFLFPTYNPQLPNVSETSNTVPPRRDRSR